MKTAEEMIASFGDDLTHYEEVVEAMKKYAEQFIELAADQAEVKINYGFYINGDPDYIVDKDSILKLKQQIK